MGSLFIQVGQCGCQIGAKLNPLLANSYYCTRNRPPNRLHCIMIDTEPKVLKKYQQKCPKWLDLDNIKNFEHGRGNNWSYGYLVDVPSSKINANIMSEYRQFSHKSQNELLKVYVQQNKQISAFILQKIRRQLQTIDCALAINVISSLGGGTGSGLGAKTVQQINQQFNIDVFSHAILPNMSGETPLQVYNCLLSLSILQQSCTAIFPIQNQKYLEYFRSKNKEYFSLDSLDSINFHIASTISQFIKINDIPGYDRFYNDIASSHILSNEMKYLTLVGSSSNSLVNGWDESFNDMFEKLKIFNTDFSVNSTFAGTRQSLLSGEVFFLANETTQYAKKYKKKFENILNPLETNFEFTELLCDRTEVNKQKNRDPLKQSKNEEKNSHEALLIMNHSNISRYLIYLCREGKQKYNSKAYLWHYKYVDVEQAIEKVQASVDQYKMLAHGKLE